MDDTTTAPAATEKAPRSGKYDATTFKLKTNENWRRAGSHGHKTIQLLIDTGGEMTGRQLVDAGGRIVDVKWDLDKNADKIEMIEG